VQPAGYLRLAEACNGKEIYLPPHHPLPAEQEERTKRQETSNLAIQYACGLPNSCKVKCGLWLKQYLARS